MLPNAHHRAGVLLALLVLLPAALAAQENPEPTAVAPPAAQPLPEDVRTELDAATEQIDANIAVLADLKQRLTSAEGVRGDVLAGRIENTWNDTLGLAIDYAETVADQRDQGFSDPTTTARARQLLIEFPESARNAIKSLSARLVFPDFSAPVVDQATADQEFFTLIDGSIKTNRLLGQAIELSERLEIDGSAARAELQTDLQEFAESAAVFLELARSELAGVNTALDTMPDNSELAARQRVATSRLQRTASAIEANIAQMKQLEVPAAQYEKQLLQATGEISASILDVEVVSSLLRDAVDNLLAGFRDKGPAFLLKLLVFVVILLITWKLAGLVQRAVDTAMRAAEVSMSQLLRSMVLSTSRNLVLVVGALIALSQIGISLGPLLAGLGIAGFILGFALQDSLSNFASGMLILLYKPFDMGDTIEVAGAYGRVSHMTLVNTTIMTFDNQSLIVPNNKIWQDVIKNVTAQANRRVDLEFGVAYDADLDAVEKLLAELVAEDERILSDPEPVIKIASFGDSAINIICRPWVKTADYWDVYWDMNKRVKRAFDAAGIGIPFPQRDIHIYQHDDPGS